MVRPRFSLRTLAVLVTLVCAYFGAWEAMKKHVLPKDGQWLLGEHGFMDVTSPIPFVLRNDEEVLVLNGSPSFRTASLLSLDLRPEV